MLSLMFLCMIIIIILSENIQGSCIILYVCRAGEPVKCIVVMQSCLVFFEAIATYLIALKFICITLGKYCKLLPEM